MKFSIILPTFNEKNNIIKLLSLLKNILINYSYEIIVVDDNSSDGTWQFVKEYSKKNKRVRLLRRTKKKGLSSAIRDGIRKAKNEYVVVMDADGQHDEKILPKIIKEIQNNDLVVASRRKWSKFSTRSKFAKFISKTVLGVRLSDPLSGYFALRKTLFNKIDKELKPKGFKFLLEFYVKAKPTRVKEVFFDFKDRKKGKSKQSIKVMIDFLISVIHLFVYKLKKRSNLN